MNNSTENNHIDEFRNSENVMKMVDILSSYSGRNITLMEVCGTHTMSIYKHGIRGILPKNISIVSGPGCPVCVTPSSYIDCAVKLAKNKEVILATFGDMMRIPGSVSSLSEEKARGSNIKIIYSPLDCLKLASENPDRRIVFLSVGFETTTPIIALTILEAEKNGINNFSILTANKTMPEVLRTLVKDKDLDIDGFIYPGHVSAIIGTSAYEELAFNYKVSGVIAGFEPLDILYAIIKLSANINDGRIIAQNLYSRVVKSEGNVKALKTMYEVFEPCDSEWRGIGKIASSGLQVKEKYVRFDAWKIFDVKPEKTVTSDKCLCGMVLKGRKSPGQCSLFGKECTPEKPVGACMVSSEGTCAAFYKYGG